MDIEEITRELENVKSAVLRLDEHSAEKQMAVAYIAGLSKGLELSGKRVRGEKNQCINAIDANLSLMIRE